MGNKRIYLGREVSKYAEIAGGAILTITALFFVLMVVGLEITGSDDICLGTLNDPCVSYGKICNLGPNNYDIYNSESIQIDFSPDYNLDYWIFFRDGRVKKEFLEPQGIEHSTVGWRYENFTDATKPRSDRVYVHRFARYSCQDYMLVGLKNNPNDVIKWGVGVGKEYLDPFWYGVNDTANISISNNLTMELGSQINITSNISGVSTVCVDVNHPEYGNEYACGSPNANFLFNISYFRKTELNDSSTTKNISWVDGGNQTVYIQGHQYDEIVNVSINISGYISNNTYPTDLRIYINNSLSNIIPETALTNSLTTLSDDSTVKNITFESPFYIEALKILGSASVSSAYLNLSGFGDYSHGTSLGSDFNVGSYSIGITNNGTYFWVVSDGDNKVYEYYMNGTSTGFNFSTKTTRPYGITQNGTYFWIVDGYDQATNVSKFYMNGTYTGETFDVGCTHPSGITQNNVYIWVACYNPNSVRKFSMDGDFISTFAFNYGTPYGMTNDGVHIWISDHLNSKVYKYLMSGTYTGVSFNTVGTGSGITQNGEFFWSLPWSASPTTEKYSMGYVVNASLEVGVVDGIKEWNYTGLFNETIRIDNFNSSINTALQTCSTDESGYCNIPLYFISDYYGIIQISDIEINYTQNPNPIYLNTNLISSFLGNSSGHVDIPIKFESSQNGTLEISDIKFDYAGGNDTIEVLVWEKNISLDSFNNSLTEEELNFLGNQNITRYVSFGLSSEINHAYLNLSGKDKYPASIDLTVFNNSNSIENLTFIDNKNLTRYLNIPKDSNVTSAYLNLSGYKSTEGTDLGDDFAVGRYTIGLENNDTHFWAVSDGDNKVYEYYINGTTTGFSFNTLTTRPYGITQNSTYFWIVDGYDQATNFSKFLMNGTYTGETFNAGCTHPSGITQNNTYIWVACYNPNSVRRFYMNGTYIDNFAFNYGTPYGMTNNNEFIWISDHANSKVYKFLMNGTDTGISFNTVGTGSGVTQNGEFFWTVPWSTTPSVRKYEMTLNITNPYLEISTPDGSYEWNHTGEFNSTFSPNKTSDFSSNLNSALNSGACDCTGCILDGNNCTIPFLFHSDTAGKLEYSAIEISYKAIPLNPWLEIGTSDGTREWIYNGEFNQNNNKTSDLSSVINSALNSGACDCTGCVIDGSNCSIPFKFHSDYPGGFFNYSAIDILYDDKGNNETLNLINYYSDWDYEFPSYISWLEFIPKSPTTKNVTPYGQTDSRSIFNITNYGYGGKESNFSIYLNESHACVNLTMSTTENKTDGFVLNSTWKDYFTNFDYLESQGLWMWADYNCNYTTWKLWEPDLLFRNCCEGCVCSEDVT